MQCSGERKRCEVRASSIRAVLMRSLGVTMIVEATMPVSTGDGVLVRK